MSRTSIVLRLIAAVLLLFVLVVAALGMMNSTAPDKLIRAAGATQLTDEPSAISLRTAVRDREAGH
jgi:hypothetical protein